VTKNLVMTLAAVISMSGLGAAAAQEPSTAPAPLSRTPPTAQTSPNSPKLQQNIPLELQVVISRYQGEKRISSLPYVLSLKSYVNSFRSGPTGASLRLGSRVPIRSQMFAPPSDGKPASTTNSVSYENVGTNIDAGASMLEDGRFEVTVIINESSVVTDPQDLKATPGSDSYPVFRSYQSTNTFFVKEGQTTQFTAASDRVSGEVVRVEVKLTVVK
jgi:hypothetical protein